jgi:hypothetical protein
MFAAVVISHLNCVARRKEGAADLPPHPGKQTGRQPAAPRTNDDGRQ